MCIATATDHDIAKNVISEYNIMKYINFILSCGDVSADKEKPDIFYACSNKLNLLPEEIVVFEDGMLGAQTAKLAGFNTCAVYDQTDSDEYWNSMVEMCDRHILSFNELM